MGFRDLVEAWGKILKLAKKPERDEYLTGLKMSLLGILIVGIIAFVIRLLMIVYVFPQQIP